MSSCTDLYRERDCNKDKAVPSPGVWPFWKSLSFIDLWLLVGAPATTTRLFYPCGNLVLHEIKDVMCLNTF